MFESVWAIKISNSDIPALQKHQPMSLKDACQQRLRVRPARQVSQITKHSLFSPILPKGGIQGTCFEKSDAVVPMVRFREQPIPADLQPETF